MTSLTDSLLQNITPWLNRSLVVAFSGGIDSTVLLHSLVSLRNAGQFSCLKAIHVNHGLSPNAQKWVNHCQQICDQWLVPLVVESVQVSNTLGEGLEQAARSARYQVFERVLGGGDCLVQGHHQNDQAETLLFRLFRGTGVTGLSGIPLTRSIGKSVLVRPMLSISREQIECYAKIHGLNHIEDESNQDQRFSRNYIRQSLLPAVEQRWPGAAIRLASLADELAEINMQQDHAVSELAQSITEIRREWLLGDKPLLDSVKLEKFHQATQKQIIRIWLKNQGLSVPGRDMLDRVFAEVINARVDAEPLLIWPGCELRRYQQLLVASKPMPEIKPFTGIYWTLPEQVSFSGPGIGYLRFDYSSKANAKAIRTLSGGAIELRSRDNIDPSLRVAVAGRSGRKTLKRWLQEYRVPPWLRDRIPFLFYNNEMIGAPGLWVCEGFQADSPGGYHITWQC